MRKYDVAVCQMDTGADRAGNLKQATDLIGEAASHGARLAALPEYFNCLGDKIEPEPLDGVSVTAMREAAVRHKIWILCGSFTELNSGGLPYNTSVLIDDAGELRSTYRKIHLFDIALKTQSTTPESTTRAAGKQIVNIDTELGNLGLSICYDIRFPELYRILALRGVQILFAPANFLMNTGKDHWEPILRARAIENGCYVVAPCQTGKKAKSASLGKSIIVDPWGNVVAKAREGVGIALAEIDLDYLDSIREQIPTLANRRDDIYNIDTKGETIQWN